MFGLGIAQYRGPLLRDFIWFDIWYNGEFLTLFVMYIYIIIMRNIIIQDFLLLSFYLYNNFWLDSSTK